MKTISINASSTYDVVIGQDLLPMIGDYIRNITRGQKAAIISDSNVWPLYGDIIAKSLCDAGLAVCNYIIPAGESSKNGTNYLSILNYLAENHITRSDVLIALGGGVVGDITGFAAATYLRGVAYIQIPTSLLAMVDSSVGGKTAIDLPSGKNLAGAFYQPKLVLCDINTLNTLTPAFFRDGCAEVIKYGVLFDPVLLEHLQQFGTDFDREYVVSRCVSLKQEVVAADEFDHGQRQKLNLGHTIGHGIEAAGNYTISHGYAVAAGMAIVGRAAAAIGHCTDETAQKIDAILKIFDLPTTTTCTAEELAHHALTDKKRFGGTVNLIIPNTIGMCSIVPTPVENLRTFIEAGL